MLRNHLAAALRNLSRHKLNAAINIVGLSVALAAAGLIALFVRDELSYETWIPGYQDIYIVGAGAPGHPTSGLSPSNLAGWLGVELPQIQAVARISPALTTVRRGNAQYTQSIFWADASFFEIFPFPLLAGDPRHALDRPDSVVITHSIARKYFGRDRPIGEVLEVRGQPLRISAVMQDLPSNTHLRIDILVPARAAFSDVAVQDASPMTNFGAKPWMFATYIRLRPNADIDALRRALPEVLDKHAPMIGAKRPSQLFALTAAPIADIHLRTGELRTSALSRGSSVQLLFAAAGIGILLVAIASFNFINLMTARAARRSVEVGVRKAVGASRSQLIVQFLGETALHVAVAMCVALLIVELLLPQLNAFLDRRIVFGYSIAPWLAILSFTVVLSVLTGIYPAFVLSACRPTAVLKRGIDTIGASGAIRQGLVVIQLAVLIGLIAATIVFARQNAYAMNMSLRQSQDQFFALSSPCREALVQQLAALHGVSAVACSSQFPQLGIGPGTAIALRSGKYAPVKFTAVGAGFFKMYGIAPVAGRLFSADRKSDITPGPAEDRPEPILVNEAAVRALGYPSAAAFVGQIVKWDHMGPTHFHPAQIIGVVQDFVIGSVRDPIPAAAFYLDPQKADLVHIRLRGAEIPQTLASINLLWKSLGDGQPLNGTFLSQQVRNLYRDVIQETQLSYVFAGTALLVTCLGLLGLATFTTERRTKEIGVRKAMGAESRHILHLLLLQVTQPVLWATLVAIPVAHHFTAEWLHGFAYRIPLDWWIFALAAVLALFISVLTVSVQVTRAAQAKPVVSLRYE